ncbi:hypothetical protein QDY71_07835 [Kingella negevensis]|uniref:hypothetical protein n=1 Tax=Kingella negevensis TaxID=1522312 RepID=UPI002543BA6B|nr:hypothetical protein [Kingella negevensis]MDK4697658.1 hypothetical protein [Kingella negevensis]WII92953.1 hypothetical protein QEO94_10030 [Kingella negevensis]
MINLYQILQLSHNASPATIQAVLNNAQNANAIKAVQEWLLVPDVRQRYNVKLKSEYPEFFQAATPINKPKIAPLSEETADDDEYMDLPPLWNPNAAANWIWAGIFSARANKPSFQNQRGSLKHENSYYCVGQ